MSINQRIKDVMLRLGKTTTDLAEELEVTKSTITRSRQGETLPSSKMLIPLGEKLNVNINWLLFGKGEMFIGGQPPNNQTLNEESNLSDMERLKKENEQLKERLKDKEEIIALLKGSKNKV